MKVFILALIAVNRNTSDEAYFLRQMLGHVGLIHSGHIALWLL